MPAADTDNFRVLGLWIDSQSWTAHQQQLAQRLELLLARTSASALSGPSKIRV